EFSGAWCYCQCHEMRMQPAPEGTRQCGATPVRPRGDSSECADLAANGLKSAMAGAWSARVLLLIVELFEFRLVAGTNTGAANKSLRAALLVDRLPPETHRLVMEATAPNRRTHFGAFEVDLRSGELYKQ